MPTKQWNNQSTKNLETMIILLIPLVRKKFEALPIISCRKARDHSTTNKSSTLICNFKTLLSKVISSVSSRCVMSNLITSLHYIFGLPLPLLTPTINNQSHLLIGYLHFASSCAQTISASLILSTMEATPTLYQMSSFHPIK